MSETRFWLIRHALVDENARAILYGVMDVALCETTLAEQAPMYRSLARRLPRPAHWYVTPLSRTRRTAEAIGDGMRTADFGRTVMFLRRRMERLAALAERETTLVGRIAALEGDAAGLPSAESDARAARLLGIDAPAVGLRPIGTPLVVSGGWGALPDPLVAALRGVDIRIANAQVTAVSQTLLRQMPPNATPPLILNYNASTVPIIQLALSGQGVTEQQLADTGLNVVRKKII